jgi:hypothetical protein
MRCTTRAQLEVSVQRLLRCSEIGRGERERKTAARRERAREEEEEDGSTWRHDSCADAMSSSMYDGAPKLENAVTAMP